VAAIVGKPVADWAKDLVPSLSFAGSYLIFSACALGTLLLFPLMRFARSLRRSRLAPHRPDVR
jgi:hypothetical protein